jgi:arylsulfatase A-like enzyme
MIVPPPAQHELKRLSSVVIVLVAGVLATVAWKSDRLPAPASGGEPPRLIVLVTIDALRADHLGVYGYGRPTSPQIDAFAREALVVEDAIAQAPYTKASIASLMTGLYPTTHKTYTTAATIVDTMDGHVDGARGATDVLPESVTTLAEALRGRGYGTAALTTNPFLIRDFGFAQGFDRFEFIAADGFAAAGDVLGRALRVIAERDRPLFLWVHLMEPHSPYAPGEAFERELPPLVPARPIPESVTIPPYLAPGGSRDARFYETLYDREIRNVDAAFGAFVAEVRRDPDWGDTVLVLTADHGEEFFEHGGLEHNATLYDELVRVPLIMRVPGLGARYLTSQAQLVDLMPTIVALAGGEAIAGIHGHDLRPLLRGESHPADPAYAEIVGQQYAVRTREWKVVAGPGEERLLYALTRDPGEQHNLAPVHPRQLAAMEHVLERMVASAVNAGRRIAGATAPVDDATMRRLEALGYVQK